MLNQMTSFFTSAFYFQGTNWKMILLAIVVGLIFGAIWLTLYRPPLFRQTQLWVVATVSAILTWTAIAFVQVPLQSWYGRALDYFWNQNTIGQWMLLAGIPLVLLSGLVQEASKLAPVLIYWWYNGKRFTPKFGLIVGAVSGAGFGIFEAIWIHNQIFASGVSWSLLGDSWLGLWERFFSVAFHIALSALTGYGLAKRKGCQFYLIAAFLHGLMNYSIILIEKNLLTSFQDGMITAILAVAVTAVALWLLRRKTKEVSVSTSSDVTSASTPPTVVS
jgi:RsiW-degrading membrane proteinase PrsW (M82 family)